MQYVCIYIILRSYYMYAMYVWLIILHKWYGWGLTNSVVATSIGVLTDELLTKLNHKEQLLGASFSDEISFVTHARIATLLTAHSLTLLDAPPPAVWWDYFTDDAYACHHHPPLSSLPWTSKARLDKSRLE